jgi:hypothetical protein
MGSFLDKPVVEHHVTPDTTGNGLTAAMACMQGWRVDMEVRRSGAWGGWCRPWGPCGRWARQPPSPTTPLAPPPSRLAHPLFLASPL